MHILEEEVKCANSPPPMFQVEKAPSPTAKESQVTVILSGPGELNTIGVFCQIQLKYHILEINLTTGNDTEIKSSTPRSTVALRKLALYLLAPAMAILMESESDHHACALPVFMTPSITTTSMPARNSGKTGFC